MKKNMFVILGFVSFILFGCTSKPTDNATNLMDDIPQSSVLNSSSYNMNDKNATATEITQFSLSIFKESFEKDANTLLSPLSIISALAMTANGAKNETLTQMEDIFSTDIQSLNGYLKAYLAYLPYDEKYAVRVANSIWIKDAKSLTVYEDFLQVTKDYYNASIYKTPFNASTKDDINNWVKDATDGQIEGILQEAPSSTTILYLVNAMSFDAEWKFVYDEVQVREGIFTLENGEEQDVEFMYSDEYVYIEIDGASGFIKQYKDDSYAFVALLPNEDIHLADFLNTLNAKELVAALEKPEITKVSASIPKFSNEYSVLLNEVLKNLGMTAAFDANAADFSALGTSTIGNVYIHEIIHQTKITVDENGTKAGAVTAVMAVAASIEPEPKYVHLNRPFFYMVIDKKQNVPLFMGSVVDMQK